LLDASTCLVSGQVDTAASSRPIPIHLPKLEARLKLQPLTWFQFQPRSRSQPKAPVQDEGEPGTTRSWRRGDTRYPGCWARGPMPGWVASLASCTPNNITSIAPSSEHASRPNPFQAPAASKIRSPHRTNLCQKLCESVHKLYIYHKIWNRCMSRHTRTIRKNRLGNQVTC
jgi:hypothetical protein